MLKRILNFILIIVSVLILSGCELFFIIDYEIPPLEEYQINDILFDNLTSSLIKDFEDIDEELIEETKYGNIYVYNTSYNSKWFFSNKSYYSGSGVIFYESELYYYALTNAHVLHIDRDYNNQSLEVYDYFNNRYSAFIYENSINEELDLGILVFPKYKIELTVLSIVYGEIPIGDNVIAIGNPLGERNVLTVGKVINYNKTRVEDRYGDIKTNEFLSIVHTAKINSGSSGGMLLDFDLNVVGINYASNREELNPEGFSISSKMVIDYLRQLIVA